MIKSSLPWALAVALLVLTPLMVLPGIHDPFRLPKQVFSDVLALGMLTAMSWQVARSSALRSGLRRQSGPLPAAVVALLPLAAVVLASAATSPHPEHAARAAIGFAISVAVLCGLASWGERSRRLLDWLAIPATLLAALALLQYFQHQPDPGPIREARLRLGSLAGNVGDLSAYLVLPALVAQSRLGTPRPSDKTWLWASALAIWLAVLLAAQTLVPLVALAASSAVLWTMGEPTARRRWPMLAVLAGVALAAMGPTPLLSRLGEEWRELRSGSMQDVLSGRLDGWRAGLHIGGQNLLLGAGPGTYRAEFADAKLALAERGVPFYRSHGYATHFDHAHSEPIEVLADLGVAGLLASAWLLWWLGRGALERRDPEERAFGVAAIVAFLVFSCFWFPLRTALVTWPFVVAGAWLLGATQPQRSSPESTTEDTVRKGILPPRNVRSWIAAAATVLLGTATVWSSYCGVERLRANRVLRVAEDQASAMTRRGTLDRGVLRQNIAALTHARAGAPDDARIPHAIGSHYLLLDELSSAESWYRSTLELAPRAETYLNLGRTLWLRGDSTQAHQMFDRAVTLSPALAPEVPGR
ncbi:MAG TPA: O-antigen ligase family protein [Thermoanaerobaculia bacterium]|nr:O-antigen ligase family protein [Thermoanaerobaculia bacterium]